MYIHVHVYVHVLGLEGLTSLVWLLKFAQSHETASKMYRATCTLSLIHTCTCIYVHVTVMMCVI